MTSFLNNLYTMRKINNALPSCAKLRHQRDNGISRKKAHTVGHITPTHDGPWTPAEFATVVDALDALGQNALMGPAAVRINGLITTDRYCEYQHGIRRIVYRKRRVNRTSELAALCTGRVQDGEITIIPAEVPA